MTSVGIEPTTSGLGLPLQCRLSYEVGQRKSGMIKVVNRGEEKVRVHMNVVPRSTKNTNGGQRINSKCKLKCYVKPMKDPLGVSPSKGNQGTTCGKEKLLLTSVGIEPKTSGLDLPLLCRLSYEVGQRKSGTIKLVNRGEEKVRVHMNVVPRSTRNTNGGTEN